MTLFVGCLLLHVYVCCIYEFGIIESYFTYIFELNGRSETLTIAQQMSNKYGLKDIIMCRWQLATFVCVVGQLHSFTDQNSHHKDKLQNTT